MSIGIVYKWLKNKFYVICKEYYAAISVNMTPFTWQHYSNISFFMFFLLYKIVPTFVLVAFSVIGCFCFVNIYIMDYTKRKLKKKSCNYGIPRKIQSKKETEKS